MKERPIIFSTDEVRAILDGRKTQARRVIKPQLHKVEYTANPKWKGKHLEAKNVKLLDDKGNKIRYPYGVPGGKLWVRETYWDVFKRTDDENGCVYKADYGHRIDLPENQVDPKSWRHSDRMPKWASRIMLEVTGVRVVRVQEISTDDILAEGTPPMKGILWENNTDDLTEPSDGTRSPLFWSISFKELWDSINKKRGFGWDTNCWVWAISFKRVNKNA